MKTVWNIESDSYFVRRAVMAYQKWTGADRKALRKMAGNMPAPDIARKMKRSLASVNNQIGRLGLSGACAQPSTPPDPAVEKHIRKRKFDPSDPALRSATVYELRRAAKSTDELAEYLGTVASNAEIMMDSLRQAGYHVQSANGRYKIGALLADTVPVRVTAKRFGGPEQAFGIISDPSIAAIFSCSHSLCCSNFICSFSSFSLFNLAPVSSFSFSDNLSIASGSVILFCPGAVLA